MAKCLTTNSNNLYNLPIAQSSDKNSKDKVFLDSLIKD